MMTAAIGAVSSANDNAVGAEKPPLDLANATIIEMGELVEASDEPVASGMIKYRWHHYVDQNL